MEIRNEDVDRIKSALARYLSARERARWSEDYEGAALLLIDIVEEVFGDDIQSR